GRAPERKVASATSSGETASSKLRTCRRTSDDWQRAVAVLSDPRLQHSRVRKRASGCRSKCESSRRRRRSGTTSRSASNGRGSSDELDERRSVRTETGHQFLRV